MMLKIFEPLTAAEDTFSSCFLGILPDVIDYEYTQLWAGTGTFSLTVPLTDRAARLLQPFRVLCAGDDWLMVTQVNFSESSGKIAVSGTDLCGILDHYLTLWADPQTPGAEGYDVVAGTLYGCVRHYINNNIISPADNNRQMLHFNLAAYDGVGSVQTHYMARLQQLSVVVADLCGVDELGYTVAGDFRTNKYVMELLQGRDRSAGATGSKIILSAARGDAVEVEYVNSTESLINAIYATGAGVTELVTRTNTAPQGIYRREGAVSVQADSVNDIPRYALNAMRDNVQNVCMTVQPRLALWESGEIRLGDIVTAIDDRTDTRITARITAVRRTESGSGRSVYLTVGTPVQKLLNRIITDIYNGIAKRR